MAAYLFHGGYFLDPRKAELQGGVEVLIEDDRVKEVSDRPISAASADRVDLRGRTLMPGLIDAHIHIFLAEVNLALLEGMPLTLLTTKAVVSRAYMVPTLVTYDAMRRT
jgi:imidazolonepropionase-like amidohydrolase